MTETLSSARELSRALEAMQRQLLEAALRRPRYEVLPLDGTADAVVDHVPREVTVTVTASPRRGMEPTLALSESLARQGYRVVPHLAARLVIDESHLRDMLCRISEAGIRDIFVIAGDGEPAGVFPDSLRLLSALREGQGDGLGQHLEQVGVAGYPEGHPDVSDAQLTRALLAKQPSSTYLVTQLCFSARTVSAWVDRMRAAGVSLPVYPGVAGVVDQRKLLRVAQRIGVGQSVRFLRKHHGLLRLLSPGGYRPDGLVRELASRLAPSADDMAGLHVYTLGAVAATERWRREALEQTLEAVDRHRSRRRRVAPPSRYSALALVRHGVTGQAWPRAWDRHEPRDGYDVVIVGGGVHGLATAYYLATNHGIDNVAVLEKSYIGSGGSGRNTAILRSNYLTAEGVQFYDRSLQLYRRLAEELNFNVMFSRRGHLTLAHSDASLRTMRWRAEVNKLSGVDSEVIDADEVQRLVPYLDTSTAARYPILGALYHPPGGIIRHDAVVWGYARAASALGVHVHQDTEVTGIDVNDGRVRGVQTTRGPIAAPIVVNATAGWSSLISAMAGVRMPVQTFPLQAAVTEPVRPFLHTVVVSGTLHVYMSQTARGEIVFGASVDPFASYSTRGSLDFLEGLASHVLELMPSLATLRVLRQWAGLCDMTPDFAPIMGRTHVEGFLVDVGWGTYGFKAGPVSGEAMAECIATGRTPELISAFGLHRFAEGELVGEKGAAAVGH